MKSYSRTKRTCKERKFILSSTIATQEVVQLDRSKKIPKNVHTIFSFNLPYAIPIPDGRYLVRIGKHIAEVAIKRNQKKEVEGGKVGGTGTMQIMFDKYGKSSFSSIQMKLPLKMDISEDGRKPLLLGLDVSPRRKAKEITVRFLNRLIEAVRYVTEEYWVESARYQDISTYEMFYWDGKKRYPVGLIMLDTGVGGFKLGTGHPFQVEAEKMQNLNNILVNELELDPSKIFLLNSKDACLQEDFRLAIIEAVTALEIMLYRFIRRRGEKLGIPSKIVEKYIVGPKGVGLTGNITEVLKGFTKDLEQIDDKIVSKCKGAITTRNSILHKGLLEVSSTETEERIIAIEEMIAYLNRLLVKA